jgi:hypothetical protein
MRSARLGCVEKIDLPPPRAWRFMRNSSSPFFRRPGAGRQRGRALVRVELGAAIIAVLEQRARNVRDADIILTEL